MATLYCSPPLVKFTGGAAESRFPGGTVPELLTHVAGRWPALVAAVTDGRRPRAGVLVFVDGRQVSDLASVEPLSAESRVELVTIAYGG